MFSEYLFTNTYRFTEFCNMQREAEEEMRKIFHQCILMIESIDSYANYANSPRFFTKLQLKFTRGFKANYSLQHFTICFHIFSSCPGLKRLFHKILYKTAKRHSISLTIKQYLYPGREHGQLNDLSDNDLKHFLLKKCNFCCHNGLFGAYLNAMWKNKHFLNSSVMFNRDWSIAQDEVKSEMFFCNSNFKITQGTSATYYDSLDSSYSDVDDSASEYLLTNDMD